MVSLLVIKGTFSQLNQTSFVNKTNMKMELTPEEGKFVDSERILKFYISSDSGCNVDMNDTILYDTKKLKSPIEHVVLNKHKNSGYNISPKGVYSEDVDIEYFGFSKKIKTFSTYFKKPHLNNSKVAIEYIYNTRNLIKSFSDFRDEASYENITYNYNLISWYFKNENYNNETQKLKIELFFDLGDNFVYEQTKFSIPMDKTVVELRADSASNKRRIVKFTSSNDLNLKFNQSLLFEFHFPLYFENCKNYNLNFLVVLTGFMLFGFFTFIIYRIILVIFEEEKEEPIKNNN